MLLHRKSSDAIASRVVIRPRSPHLVIGGLLLVAIAGVALWIVADLSAGDLRSVGPAMLPRWLAFGLGLCGAAIAVSGFVADEDGDATRAVPVRGPVMILAAIFLFALTIRPLGLAFAGPATLILGGYATAEARLRELIVLACFLTAFCILLFGDMLNLPIPVFPVQLIERLPDGWSLKFAMRFCAGLVTIVGLLVALPALLARSRAGTS